jgi:hypothetical protein
MRVSRNLRFCLHSFSLKMEAICSSETVVTIYKITQRHIAEYSNNLNYVTVKTVRFKLITEQHDTGQRTAGYKTMKRKMFYTTFLCFPLKTFVHK